MKKENETPMPRKMVLKLVSNALGIKIKRLEYHKDERIILYLKNEKRR